MSVNAYEPSAGASDVPARGAVEITPHDTNTIVDATGAAVDVRSLYIGVEGAGALRVMMRDDTIVNFAGLTANTILPIRVKKVLDTGTDVAGIVGLL